MPPFHHFHPRTTNLLELPTHKCNKLIWSHANPQNISLIHLRQLNPVFQSILPLFLPSPLLQFALLTYFP
jgi:hypothetical protein